LGDANQLAVGMTTRLLDNRQGRQFLAATLGQAYFFETPRVRLPDEPDTRRDTSDLIAEVEVSAFQNWNLRYAQQWDPDESLTERSEFLVQYRPRVDSVVNAGYRYRRGDVEQFDVSAAWPLGERWRGFGRWVYSTREEKTLDQVAGFEYGDCCWAVRVIARRFVSSRTGDSDTSIGLELELKGLSSVGVDNQAFLRESIRGYSSAPFEP
jgi:LPS-assembly protein